MEDRRTTQQKHWDKLYDAFYAFYQKELAVDPPAHERVRLMKSTQFFEDIALRRAVDPIFAEYVTTPEDKRAIARAAYFDALTIHNRTAGIKFETVDNKKIISGEARGTY